MLGKIDIIFFACSVSHISKTIVTASKTIRLFRIVRVELDPKARPSKKYFYKNVFGSQIKKDKKGQVMLMKYITQRK